MKTVAMLLALLVAGALLSRHGVAELLVKGTGPKRVLVKEQFGEAQAGRYDLFAVKCTRCHAMGRIIDSLTWGYTPMTGSTFDEPAIRRYVIKMMRKAKSGISKRDARELTEFLLAALALAGAPAPPAPEARP